MRPLLTVVIITASSAALYAIWKPVKTHATTQPKAIHFVEESPPPTLGRVPIQPSPRNSGIPKKPAKGRMALLDCIAKGESNNNPRAVSKSGTYRGLFQFDLRTWGSVGGTGDPIDASVEEQYYRAGILLDRRGTQPWPVVGRRCR